MTSLVYSITLVNYLGIVKYMFGGGTDLLLGVLFGTIWVGILKKMYPHTV